MDEFVTLEQKRRKAFGPSVIGRFLNEYLITYIIQ